MIEKLKIETQIVDKKLIAELSGCIDEDADFKKILNIKQDHYIFDFDQVTMINSCGIREWINFIDKLGASAKIEYHNCRQIIIEQINMVQGFIRAGAKIVSFYAPYYCADCEMEQKVKINTKDIQKSHAPKSTCPHCKKDLEFDAIEEQYFAFLSQENK